MTNPTVRNQLSNIWEAALEDLMSMSDSEIDAELREFGVDPGVAAEKGKQAVERGVAKERARQRAQLRERMEDSRSRPKLVRDPAITPDQARQHIALLQAANDAQLTMAARNRDPNDLNDEEALELYWKIEELKS